MTFIEFSAILTLGFFFNTISSPAGIIQIGTSRLKWVVIASVILAMLNVTLGFCWGWLYGGKYVVMAFAISHMVSGMTIIIAYHRENNIPLRSLMAAEHVWLFVGVVFALGFYYQMYRMGYDSFNLTPTELDLLVIGVGLAVIVIPAWLHPVRIRLSAYAASQWVRRRGLQEKT
jgi:O-antigen/teichoic acid export membrane protein